ncbi:unnamed protein product [Symbiodinium sp. CCMP2592]|nr:unnamed protein product [Symbiodinium sp. CCMP2592]
MAPKAAAFGVLLLSAAAADSGWSALSQPTFGRRTQALPDGFEINETMNGSIPITVIPSWDIFLGFSLKTIEGRMSLNIVYGEEAENFVEHPENMVDVVNFGSGSGDINESTSSARYDMMCYPFDIKTVHFQISLQNPCGIFYRLELGCVGENSWKQAVDDEDGTVRKCSWPINGSFGTFDWQNFTCTLRDSVTIECAMTGTRQWPALLKTYMWPSVVYGVMGFMSFSLGVKLSMPRVATTMLALLSLTNLRNQVIALLPLSQKTSWLEEYFLIAISFMFLNLLGHAASFHRHHTQRMVNKFNLWGVFSVFVLVVVARLHIRECPLIDPAMSVAITYAAAAACISIIAFLVWYHREAHSEFTACLWLCQLGSTAQLSVLDSLRHDGKAWCPCSASPEALTTQELHKEGPSFSDVSTGSSRSPPVQTLALILPYTVGRSPSTGFWRKLLAQARMRSVSISTSRSRG